MIGFLFTIIVIWAIIAAIKNSDRSESRKANESPYTLRDLAKEFDKEIRLLEKKIDDLQTEVNILKGLPPKKASLEEEIIEPPPPPKENVLEKSINEDIDWPFGKNEPQNEYEKTINQAEANKAYKENKQPADVKQPSKKDQKTNIETILTPTLFNKIGAVALILGIGFFLKYSFDQSLISPLMQVIATFLFSIGLIIGSNHFFKKEEYKNFSQGLAGAGIAILYLTSYATYSYYNLIDLPFALTLMAVATIVAFSQSIKYDSIAVALLGLLGGFVTPYMLSLNSGTSLGLVIYLLFINALIISLLIKKEKWVVLEYIGLLATYNIVYVTSGVYTFQNYETFNLLAILIPIWVGYSALDIYRISKGYNSRTLLNVINGLLFYYGIYSISHNSGNAGIFTFLISIIYLYTGLTVYERLNKAANYLKQNVLISIILLALATGIQFEDFTRIICWSLEALIILWLGIKFNRGYVYKSAIWLLSIAMFGLFFVKQALVTGDYYYSSYVPVFNIRALSFLLIIVSFAIGSKLLAKVENTKEIQEYCKFCWCSLLFVLFAVEINDIMSKLALQSAQNAVELINFNKLMIQSIVAGLYSIVLFKFGLAKNSKPYVICSSIGIVATIILLFYAGLSFKPIEQFIPVINLRFLAFLVVSVGLIYASKFTKEYEGTYSWAQNLPRTFDYIWCLLIFTLLNCEINDFFIKKSLALVGSGGMISFNQGMILALAWSIYALPLIKKGLEKKNYHLAICGSISIVFALFVVICKGFLFSPIEQYTFFFNIRMLAFAILIVALTIISSWLRQMPSNTLMYKFVKAIQITISLLILYVLTIEINDVFAKQIYLSTNGISISGSNFGDYTSSKQLIISAVWLIYSIALLFWGIVKKAKQVRIIALTLLGVTILKVFIFDLSFLNQLYRIISFVGLGGVLMILSYVYQKYSKEIKTLLLEENSNMNINLN